MRKKIKIKQSLLSTILTQTPVKLYSLSQTNISALHNQILSYTP